MVESVGNTTEKSLDELTDLFRLLSDRTRLHILLHLRQGEQNVTTLCQQLKLPQPTVSHHLGLLRMSNLIANRRAGKQVYYSLSKQFDPGMNNVLSFQADGYAVQVNPSW